MDNSEDGLHVIVSEIWRIWAHEAACCHSVAVCHQKGTDICYPGLLNDPYCIFLQAAKGLMPELKVFEWLIDRVAPAFTKTAIQHAELIHLLGNDIRCLLTLLLHIFCLSRMRSRTTA